MENLRTITRGGIMKARQMTSFFSFSFSALTVTIIFVFENSQNSVLCGLLFRQFRSVKYLNFRQKLPIQTAHHTFLESRHPVATKNPYCVLSHERSQKKASATFTRLLLQSYRLKTADLKFRNKEAPIQNFCLTISRNLF